MIDVGVAWTSIGEARTEGRVQMKREELLSRIVIDPDICFGKPTIRGH